ncbi:hypothetical protein JTE90_012095 [Oedothorax gibbosus]|uniref:U3 small nucleolar RNA-associated protein 25 homolog n=1 Tax=Oedothorax gibbosus TaxID=931172 RepID=A0AAV6UL49_9ARAC|nr:hypothetical protein JTE90_012095 [Oedothorax gibbosus]
MEEQVIIANEEDAPVKRRKLNDGKSGSVKLVDCLDEDLSKDDNDEDSEGEADPSESDTSSSHFEYELPEGHKKTDPLQYRQPVSHEFGEIGTMLHYETHLMPQEALETKLGEKSLSEMGLKKNLVEGAGELSSFQMNFLELMNQYVDISYMHRTYRRGEALRKVYTLHVLNHILTSRSRIVHHNSKRAKNPDLEFRDQGFTRPVAVILVPFRHDCYLTVKCLMQLLPKECVVSNKKRFENEYGPPPKVKKMKKKPQDYEQTFEGNIGEDFRIGLSIKNKSVALYSDFYRSDLIVGSPLGLRQIFSPGDPKDGSGDFLSSVEILVLDEVDVLYLQNLVHMMHVLERVNELPKQNRGYDFSRVRLYACDGLSRFYRQTLLFSSVEHSWFENIILRNYCANYKGYLCSVHKPSSLGISQVFVTQKMCFRIFEFDDPAKEFDARFRYFVDKVLPDFSSPDMAQTLIFVPSYFDFVRIRNHFRENEMSATMICEYSSTGKVAEARNNFFKERRHFLVYTERAHFYKRYNLKGIQHLLFYQLPTYPQFFRDLQFSMLDSCPRRKDEERSCTVLASRLDLLQLKAAVGERKAAAMLAAGEKIYMQQIVR